MRFCQRTEASQCFLRNVAWHMIVLHRSITRGGGAGRSIFYRPTGNTYCIWFQVEDKSWIFAAGLDRYRMLCALMDFRWWASIVRPKCSNLLAQMHRRQYLSWAMCGHFGQLLGFMRLCAFSIP